MTTPEQIQACRECIRDNLPQVVKEINFFFTRKLLIAPVINKAAMLIVDDPNPVASAYAIALEECFAFFTFYLSKAEIKEALESYKHL